MSRCPRCQAPVPPDPTARFCGECGAALAATGPPPAAAPPSRPYAPAAQPSSGGWGIAACVIGCLAILLLGGAVLAGAAVYFLWVHEDFPSLDVPEPFADPYSVDAPADGQPVLRNTSRWIGDDPDGRPRYEWTAYIDAPPEVLAEIASVRYYLHPTFQPDVYDVTTNPQEGFPLKRSGWGRFEIRATAYYLDGSMTELSHMLVLQRE